jgi:hypothetical protein
MAGSGPGPVADWRVRGSYFEGCNCEAICPCRSVGGRPGGPSSFGECFGALSWYIDQGHADGTGLSGLQAVLSIRYLDQVHPSTPWEVVLYVDQGARDGQRAALADIFLGRAGGTVARLYGPAIGEVYAVRPARITLEHTAARKRIDVVGYLTVQAEGDASEPGDVRCGIPGFDHPGTELHGDTLALNRPGAALGGERTPSRRLHHRLRLLFRPLKAAVLSGTARPWTLSRACRSGCGREKLRAWTTPILAVPVFASAVYAWAR